MKGVFFVDFLDTWLVPGIVAFCLVLGYLFRLIPVTDNRFTPIVVCAVGIALSVWLNWPSFTLDVVLSGAVSGLASTGMYELFAQWIKKGGD